MSVFGVEVLLIFREGSGVAALACCRAAPDSLLLLTHFLCYYVTLPSVDHGSNCGSMAVSLGKTSDNYYYYRLMWLCSCVVVWSRGRAVARACGVVATLRFLLLTLCT